MTRVISEYLDQLVQQQIHREEKESLRKQLHRARRPDPATIDAPTIRGTATSKPGVDLTKRPPQLKAPKMTAERRYQLLCNQVENAEKVEASLEQEAIEIQGRV